MKSFVLSVLLLVSTEAIAQTLAFPSAVGWGRYADGGRGGTIIKVTNLNSTGAGSLRAALETTGERIIVVDTCGVVDITGDGPINIKGEVTYAGQTAPGDGLVVTSSTDGDMFVVEGTDIIIRGLKAMPGYSADTLIQVFQIGNTGDEVDRVIIDHCTFRWGTDINISAWDTVSNLTVQNCWIGPSLDQNATGPGFGSGHNANYSVGPEFPNEIDKKFLTNFTSAYNVYFQTNARTPKFGYHFEMVNNLVYNWGSFCVELNGYAYGNMIGNVFKNGPEIGSPSTVEIIQTNTSGSPPFDTASSPAIRIYVKDNRAPEQPTGGEPQSDLVDQGHATAYCAPNCVPEQPLTLVQSGIDPFSSALVLEYTLANAGTFPRDVYDLEYIDNVEDSTGSHLLTIPAMDSYTCGSAPTDTDGDGMPDTWEIQRGHDPDTPSSTLDLNNNGYTDIEDYINEIYDGEQFSVRRWIPKRD